MTTIGIVMTKGHGHAVIGMVPIAATESGLTARFSRARVRHVGVLDAMTHLVPVSAAALAGPR
ncbi:MAG TPA: hypothetical protein VN695_07125 [Streptosporangiaceae bacterium]|nr:hypothetical protein [Streptosporangiaceae bacterium]